MGEFFHFLGASLIVAPLTFVAIFGLHWLLGKTRIQAIYRLLISCAATALVFAYFFDINESGSVSYEPQVWIVIWCLVGILPRRATGQPDEGTEN